MPFTSLPTVPVSSRDDDGTSAADTVDTAPVALPGPTAEGTGARAVAERAALGVSKFAFPDRLVTDVLATAQQLREAQFRSWVDGIAEAVLCAVRADVQSGCLPEPSDAPRAVEAALVARAEEAVGRDWFRTFLHWDDIQLVLRHAPCGPGSHSYRRWETSMAPFVYLAPLSDSPQELSGGHVDENAGDVDAAGHCAADAVIILRPGARGSSSMLGFEPHVDWLSYAFRLLRDTILLAVVDLPGAGSLRMRRSPNNGGYTLPCYVGESRAPALPEPPVSPAVGKARRRR